MKTDCTCTCTYMHMARAMPRSARKLTAAQSIVLYATRDAATAGAGVMAALVCACDEASIALARVFHSGALQCVALRDDDVSEAKLAGVEAHRRWPRGVRFGLIVVPSRWFHEQRSPAHALRRLRARLADGAQAVICADGALGMHGLADLPHYHVRAALGRMR